VLTTGQVENEGVEEELKIKVESPILMSQTCGLCSSTKRQDDAAGVFMKVSLKLRCEELTLRRDRVGRRKKVLLGRWTFRGKFLGRNIAQIVGQ
jgi:hypothetical protein